MFHLSRSFDNMLRATRLLSAQPFPKSSGFVSSYSTGKQHLFSEDELTEHFVRGWGPGGQAINKTANCVVLRHNPTGLMIKCQDTRVLAQNREIARERLNAKIDEYINGDQSETVRLRQEAESRERQRHNRAKRRLEAKIAFKQREGLDKKTLRHLKTETNEFDEVK